VKKQYVCLASSQPSFGLPTLFAKKIKMSLVPFLINESTEKHILIFIMSCWCWWSGYSSSESVFFCVLSLFREGQAADTVVFILYLSMKGTGRHQLLIFSHDEWMSPTCYLLYLLQV